MKYLTLIFPENIAGKDLQIKAKPTDKQPGQVILGPDLITQDTDRDDMQRLLNPIDQLIGIITPFDALDQPYTDAYQIIHPPHQLPIGHTQRGRSLF